MLLLCIQLGQNKAPKEKNLSNASRYQARSVVGYALNSLHFVKYITFLFKTKKMCI